MEKKCNKRGCNKVVKIKTEVGGFCSEECREEIEKNIFKVLSRFQIKI